MLKRSLINILTLDLSFRNVGYNITQLEQEGEDLRPKPLREFTFKTKPESGSKEKVVENIVNNFLKVQGHFDRLVNEIEPDLMLIEFPFTSQSAQAAMLQRLCYGLIAGFDGYGIPIVLVHPNDVKMWCCGRIKNCDKQDIQNKTLQYFPDLLELKADEHVVDSYAILLSQLENPNLILSQYLSK